MKPLQVRRIGTVSAGLLILLVASHQMRAEERPLSFVQRTLLCKSLIVTSSTRLSSTNDDFNAQGLSQVIQLTDTLKHRTIILPIFQHYSQTKSLPGKKVLDGLVWAFECTVAPSGQPYVMLLWGCTNPDAETCSTAQDAAGEWRALYDSSGHHLPVDPRNLSSSDEKKIRHLGLWSFFIRSDVNKNGGVTYFYKQGDRNSHIR